MDEALEQSSGLLDIIAANSANLIELLNRTTLDLSTRIDASECRLLEQIVAQRAFLPSYAGVPTSFPRPQIIGLQTLENAFARLQASAPLNWQVYLDCLNTGTESYAGLPSNSCSTDNHPQSLLFKAFLRPYLRGYVLDIGCGPQPIPSYLADIPFDRIYGIDPISKPEDHPFTFVSGVGEFLPFGDQSFDVLVSGTTLDHYYLLDAGMKEAARVLRPGGHFVAWITEFSGAPAYDPYGGTMTAFDSEHMYHIDRTWFVPFMAKIGFDLAEVCHFKLPFNYLFMSFVRR